MEENSVSDKREKALHRVVELEKNIAPYLQQKTFIPDGISSWDAIRDTQISLMNYWGISQADWDDWKWQLQNRICDAVRLAELLQFDDKERSDVSKVCRLYRFAISPYYLSLIQSNNAACPVRRQAVPALAEILDQGGFVDPMGEEEGSPADGIVQRYPDRVIINVTNSCAMYCRHCQRRRRIGQFDRHLNKQELQKALSYIKEHVQIRDVLITGGDALLLDDEILDTLLGELEQIPHVEIKRIGTRVPVTLPMRITDNLCRILSRHLPLYLNTQFNHPLEITPAASQACLKLARSGVALGNQSVLLAGINDDANVIKKLNQMLLRMMVRPYYLFHAKPVRGTHHFRTSVATGVHIIKALRGFTSGLAVPTYVVNVPGGLGKVALYPDSLLGKSAGQILLKTWEGKTIAYDE